MDFKYNTKCYYYDLSIFKVRKNLIQIKYDYFVLLLNSF